MNYLSIGYEKQYEKFKKNNINNNPYNFSNNLYNAPYWRSPWPKEEYTPKDKNEKILLTSRSEGSNITEEIINSYDTFEKAYEAATSLVYQSLYINMDFVNTVFSNKNIKYHQSIVFISKHSRIDLSQYTYNIIPFDPQIVNADTFNYDFFNKINRRAKLMFYKSIEEESIREYIINNMLENIDVEQIYYIEIICNDLLSIQAINPEKLFKHIYKEDIPLKQQYGLLNNCFKADRYVYHGFVTDELIEDTKTRDILEECYMNTPIYYHKALYIAEHYKRLSQKYEIDIYYDLLKNYVPYEDIKGMRYNITNDILLHAIKKCVKMNSTNYTDCLDFLFYAIDKAKKRDLNKTTLELISKIIMDKFNNCCYYYVGNNVCMTNETNMQLVANTIVNDLINSKKNKVNFIKKIQMINHQENPSLIAKCILKNIYASNDIKIKKALVKIGVEGK